MGKPPVSTTVKFAEWIRPHTKLLRAVAVREHGAAADDVFQETMTRAWRRWETYSPDRGSPRTWLLAILLDQGRRRRMRSKPQAIVVDCGLVANDHGPDTDRRLDVEKAVAALPRRQRQVVTLFYLADLPISEVAAVLNLSQGTVKSTLSDARAALKTRLEIFNHE